MNKNPKKPITQRFCETFDIPVGTFGRISFIEAVGNRELSVSGCEALITYTDTFIVLELCDGIINVSGIGMELRSFTGGRVTVSGVITSIVYGIQESGCDDD